MDTIASKKTLCGVMNETDHVTVSLQVYGRCSSLAVYSLNDPAATPVVPCMVIKVWESPEGRTVRMP